MELKEKVQFINDLIAVNQELISRFVDREDVQKELTSWSVKKFTAFAEELTENYTYQNLKILYKKYKEQED